MKRNNLTTAVVAAITGVAGIASVSNAINLNSDGVGQVLVYPYYTVNNGLNTLISVVNTTDEVKAVKVRFLEGKNSRECLDFNLYMSPYDVWTASLKAVSSTVSGYTGQDSVMIKTSDTSCTVPSIDGQEFLPYAFDVATGYDGIGRDLVRCTEGHFEMIEMANIVDTATNGGAATAATHVNGTPASCGTLVSNWNPTPAGAWIIDPTDGALDPDGTGGLFGSASLIDVANGVDVAYDADALQAYSTVAQHFNPSSLLPSLATGTAVTSNIFNNGVVQSDIWLTNPVQAVSALYMHDHIYGEYALGNNIGARTEWVVTFPTKNFYVDPARAIGVTGYEPFTETVSAIGACEIYTVDGLYDREERTPNPDVGTVIPSPRPPDLIIDEAVFCWETNVLEFENTERTSGDSIILGSRNNTHFITQESTTPTYFDYGWTALMFNQSTDDNAAATTYEGLPVTGFAVQRYTNSSLRTSDGGTLANYAGLFAHRYSKNIYS